VPYRSQQAQSPPAQRPAAPSGGTGLARQLPLPRLFQQFVAAFARRALDPEVVHRISPSLTVNLAFFGLH
jgi:hypothetical protein